MWGGNGLIENEIVVDVDTRLISPTEIQVLSVSDQNPHSFSMKIVVITKHITVWILVVLTELSSGPTESDQRNAPLIGSERFECRRIVFEEFFEHIDMIPVDLV